MGMSTNGQLAYGFALGEDIDLEAFFGDDDDHDWDTLYFKKIGFRDSPIVDGKYASYDSAEATEWRNEKETLLECSVLTYCSWEYPMYMVIVGNSYNVHRGSTTEIPDGLTADPAWKDKLKKYCSIMGFEYQEPRWLLTSVMG